MTVQMSVIMKTQDHDGHAGQHGAHEVAAQVLEAAAGTAADRATTYTSPATTTIRLMTVAMRFTESPVRWS